MALGPYENLLSVRMEFDGIEIEQNARWFRRTGGVSGAAVN